jgi:histidyl-tRNA synthetase
MGDVVLGLVLADRGLLPKDGAELLPRLVAALRKAGLHVRHSYKATRNVGKLLGDASKQRARFAVILGPEVAQGSLQVKDLGTGEQRALPAGDLVPLLLTDRPA